MNICLSSGISFDEINYESLSKLSDLRSISLREVPKAMFLAILNLRKSIFLSKFNSGSDYWADLTSSGWMKSTEFSVTNNSSL